MARPTKDPAERRQRWDALYVTDAERASVAAAAAGVGLSVSRYFMALHRDGTIVNRADWRRTVQLLGTVTQQLDVIARSVDASADSDTDTRINLSQGRDVAIRLLKLERLIRREVMPWQRARASDAAANEDHIAC